MARKTNMEVNGQDYYRVRATVFNKYGEKIAKAFYGKSKKEAEQKRDEYLEGISRGLFSDFDKVIFGEFYKEWLNNVVKISIKETSYARYEGLYRNYIKNSPIANQTVISIRSIDIQIWLNALNAEKGYHTVERIYKLLTSFFKYCFTEGLIPRSPMLAVKLPKKPMKAEKKDCLTPEDINKLFEHVKTDNSVCIYIFALGTGLRQGEILALNQKDVDLTNCTVNVNKTITKISVFDDEGNKEYQTLITKPKNNSSIRIAPIPDKIMPYLRQHITNEKKKHLANGVKFTSDSPLFTTDICTRIDASNLLKQWNKLQDELGIKKVRFHDLRHTFCTLLAETGVQLKTASLLMGHSSIETTAKIYTHVREQKKKEAVNQLNKVFG